MLLVLLEYLEYSSKVGLTWRGIADSKVFSIDPVAGTDLSPTHVGFFVIYFFEKDVVKFR